MYAQSAIANLHEEMRLPAIRRGKEAVPVGELAWGVTLGMMIWKARQVEMRAIMEWRGSCTMAPVQMRPT
jgi:hypothetical protein